MRRAGILPPSYDPLRESLQFRIALAAVDSDGHADWRVAATPEDAALTMNWNAAIKYATNLDAHGHNDWRVLTKNELNVPFNNRAAVGRFDESGSEHARGYASSIEDDGVGGFWAQHFSYGEKVVRWIGYDTSLRRIR